LPKDVNANRFFCLIGWKPGQTTYIPIWDRMEGERLWTQGKIIFFKVFFYQNKEEKRTEQFAQHRIA
jgi:hypothetical protein